MTELQDSLFEKLELLNGRLWEQKAKRETIESWLKCFDEGQPDLEVDRDHAMFLLSQFVYFGLKEVRELLRALFRDHYRRPIVEEYRRANGDTLDVAAVHAYAAEQLERTRFLGMGNPAESGTHLLYYFRQENKLQKDLFCTELGLVDGRYDRESTKLSDPTISRLVFIDDFCGSGSQAMAYSAKLLDLLREIAGRSGITLRVTYLVLMGMKDGLDVVRSDPGFDEVGAVFELDETYKCLEPGSRQFASAPAEIDQGHARSMAQSFGAQLWHPHPLGYKDSQLLMGFHHNIPDNSLPILWWDESAKWSPVFPRYHKIY